MFVKMGIKVLIGIGIIIQIVLLASIFDIYFTSPIIRGVAPVENNAPSQCKRVVVISVDGLRLDALLEDDEINGPVAPYIRWIMKHRGTWGVSQSHLPTESRPGHVAMLAGFYEDPSAVTKGWKENPVDFDSIFNRSACSFAWGSPDIVNIFYKGLAHDCAFKWVYDVNQDFAGNTMELDNWVLTQVSNFFESGGNPLLYSKSNSLFFLHLLGQDTSGHTHKPKTERYRENLRNVDRIVREVDSLFVRIFRDNGTAFVLSADHGMTDWGSHGAGDPTETLTPIVAWGRGIRHTKNGDPVKINQADITPLLAVLIGVSIPVNSVGTVPSQFLNGSRLVVAQANFLNARQIVAQYETKQAEIETKSSLLMYKHFQGLDKNKIAALKDSISADIKHAKYAEAEEKSRELIQLGLEGIAFYQAYYQRPLFFLVAVSYVSWICYLILNLHGIRRLSKASSVEHALGIAALLLTSYVIFRESLPYTYHAIALLPIFLSWLIIPHLTTLLGLARDVLTVRPLAAVLFLVGIELLVLSFFKRWVLSIILAAIVLWPLIYFKVTPKNLKLILLWGASGLSLGVFSILPVVGKQPNPTLNLLAAVSIAVIAGFLALKRTHGRWIALTRCFLIFVAGMNSYWIHVTFLTRGDLNFYNQLLSWALLASVPLLLAEPEPDVLEKLQISFLSLSIPFILLSVSHEGFFLLALFIHLACWVQLEIISDDIVGSSTFYQQYTRRKLHDEAVSFSDLRRAYFFLAKIYLAFFGIGNLATLNSFDPAWVRCFLTTFAPFTMTVLILLKVILPFFTVTLAFRVLTIILNIRMYKIFVSVLIFCNLMALNFLFLVRNEGSWLDIGTSLSHYVIQQVSIVFLLLLYFASQAVIPRDLSRRVDKSHFF